MTVNEYNNLINENSKVAVLFIDSGNHHGYSKKCEEYFNIARNILGGEYVCFVLKTAKSQEIADYLSIGKTSYPQMILYIDGKKNSFVGALVLESAEKMVAWIQDPKKYFEEHFAMCRRNAEAKFKEAERLAETGDLKAMREFARILMCDNDKRHLAKQWIERIEELTGYKGEEIYLNGTLEDRPPFGKYQFLRAAELGHKDAIKEIEDRQRRGEDE
jgi:PAS domain-containing protein